MEDAFTFAAEGRQVAVVHDHAATGPLELVVF